MNPVAFRFALTRARTTTLVVGVALAAFHVIVLISFASFLGNTPRELIPKIFTDPPRAMAALTGGAIDLTTSAGWVASTFGHPIVLTLSALAALTIVSASGVTELDRGTLDLVLARPVGRVRYLSARLVAGLVVCVAVQVFAMLGIGIAWQTLASVRDLEFAQIAVLSGANLLLWMFFCAVGLWIFAAARHRSRALGATITVIIGSFLVNFLALAFDALEAIGPLSPFRYVRAGELLDGIDVARNLAVLAVAALLCAAGGLWSFSRRDLAR